MAKKKAAVKKAPKKRAKAPVDPLVEAVKDFPPLDKIDPDEVQPALIPMSDDEVRDAGRDLATRVKELRDLKTQHAGRRVEMKKERENVQKDIDRIAGCIRQQGR